MLSEIKKVEDRELLQESGEANGYFCLYCNSAKISNKEFLLNTVMWNGSYDFKPGALYSVIVDIGIQIHKVPDSFRPSNKY